MNAIAQTLKTFWHDQRGATAIEYGLIAALVAVAVIGGASALGVNIIALFDALSFCMVNPASGCFNPGG